MSSACGRSRAAARRRSCRWLDTYRKSRSAQGSVDRVHQRRTNVDTVLLIQFADAGRAGDVDLGDVIADDVQSHEQHPGGLEGGSDPRTQPAVTFVERTAFGPRPGGQVAP